MSGRLAGAARSALLRVARVTVDELAHGGRLPAGAPHVEAVRLPAGALVRLGAHEAGSPGVEAPLWRAVQAAAARAVQGHPAGAKLARREPLSVLAVLVGARTRRAGREAGPIALVVAGEVVVVAPGRAPFEARALAACARRGLPGDAWREAPAWTCRLATLREP